GAGARVVRRDRPGIAEVAAAIDRGVAVEDLPPAAAPRHPDRVVVADLRSEIDDDDAGRALVARLALPGEHAAVGIVGDDPLESCGLAIELMERGHRAVESIEIAHQRLDAAVTRLVEQGPI